jgi:ribosome biogenesis GTPase / thiamine phosphate phosphatase
LTLKDVGYDDIIERRAAEARAGGLQVGRIVSEQKERYRVVAADGELEAEITGNLRFSARGREDFPAVGDWVMLSLFEDGFGIIVSILPRYSIIRRRAAGRQGEAQIIATNIDYALIMHSADGDFNLNRLDRYVALCGDSRIRPIIVLTKIDLATESRIEELKRSIGARARGLPIFPVSNATLAGLDALKGSILKGSTYCLLGSSGAGKSSLVNSLCGMRIMETGEISGSTNKGRHTTSHRELVVLDGGGILIDNPGMREVGMVDGEAGPGKTFDAIAEISERCRFPDCTHTHEIGCAVLEAVADGELDKDAYDNFIKLQKERDFFTSTKAEHRRKDKAFGKLVKNYAKGKNSGAHRPPT